MIFDGKRIQVDYIEPEILNLQFNNLDSRVNVFDDQTLKELEESLEIIKHASKAKGLLLSSAKDVFIVGADINEFMSHFNKSHEALKKWLLEKNRVFNGYEDLLIPTVSAINGFSFGGGFEITLTSAFRLCTEEAMMGLLETNLGIIPGWGGTIRLARLCGIKTASEWISSGKKITAKEALKAGAIDIITQKNHLVDEAVKLLRDLIKDQSRWSNRQNVKKEKLSLSREDEEAVIKLKNKIQNANYPALECSIETILKGRHLERSDAQDLECENFTILAHTQCAKNLTNVYLSDQYVKKLSTKLVVPSGQINRLLIVGSGTMGTGIACVAASNNVQVYLNDTNHEMLKEKVKVIDDYSFKQNSSAMKCISNESLEHLESVDVVIENIIEDEKNKIELFKKIEQQVEDKTIIASNTSSISISKMAMELTRPDRFCGVHFFNPVVRMPLVEVIRGKQTSEDTIFKAVSLCHQLSKKIVIVNDCPGFLVNRLLFSYLHNFTRLVYEGIDFDRIDRIMHAFGWPLGPATLLDTVGIDITYRALKSIMEAYSSRMRPDFKTFYDQLLDKKRLGEKTLKGFYSYKISKEGKKEKFIDEEIKSILNSNGRASKPCSDEVIVMRMMLPMIIEASLCLQEKIVSSPHEVDIALIYGLGFPSFRGGLLRYADDLLIEILLEKIKKFEKYDKIYRPTNLLLEMSKRKKGFYDYFSRT